MGCEDEGASGIKMCLKWLTSIQALARNATDVQQVANNDAKKEDGEVMFLIHQCVSSDDRSSYVILSMFFSHFH